MVRRLGRGIVSEVGVAKMDRVKVLRRGIRQTELASRWGVTRAAVSQVVNGQRPYSPLNMQLAEALDVALSEIQAPEKQAA